MSVLGKKLQKAEHGRVGFHCPGCGHMHVLSVEPFPGLPDRPVWSWNGSGDAPTFRPSVLVSSQRGDPPVTPENFEEYKKNPWPQTTIPWICHSFVTDGRIQFLDDCTHHLKGQTVDLPDNHVPEEAS